MSIHTRLTVAGATRRSEVVVASDEPLGTALPRLLDLLGETSGTVARPLALVAADGEQLDIARSPQQLDLADGSLLRLVRLDAAPPPPVVIDVTDAAADAHGARPDRWDDRARAVAGGVGVAATTALAGWIAPWPDPVVAGWALLGAVAVLLVVAAALGLMGLRRTSASLSAASAGLALPLATTALSAAAGAGRGGGEAALLAAGVAIATGATVVLIGLGVGLRRPGAAAGGAVGAVAGTLIVALVLAGLDAATVAAIAGTVAAFATGPLPWIALSAAGLTTLDRRVAEGERVTRPRALSSIDDAYAALTWSVASLAAVIATCGVALVLADELWSGLLALALGLTAALRSRAFPLRAQIWALWGAVAVIGLVSIAAHLGVSAGWVGTAVALVAATAVAGAVLARPAPHVRARLRGIGNVIETLAVVSLLPLLLGALGVYSELLGMFGGGS